jgi:DNA-binding protein H-NS
MSSLTLVKILANISAHEAKIVHLHEQATSLRDKERHDAIAKIRMSIVEHQLTGSECGFSNDPRSVKNPMPAHSPTGTIRYRNELGQTWSGGRGRRPSWIIEALSAGKSLEQYAVFNSTLRSAGQYLIYS